jgi:hypothetical protein
VGDAIVIPDPPLLLNAQDLVEIDARNKREGQALAGRLNHETRYSREVRDADDNPLQRIRNLAKIVNMTVHSAGNSTTAPMADQRRERQAFATRLGCTEEEEKFFI